ncbi:methylated-DNA--protein-cysteine methyltransferase [Bombina bombina]|uniref:methylated-DNA--protein-cysteine methyltransferase n=1 Tax=Bombina bombina TaxID=8345 RepID=UPI00235A994E|nr:methylated-DNA--protein-cysteine methyltransferase [Bombina bombina]
MLKEPLSPQCCCNERVTHGRDNPAWSGAQDGGFSKFTAILSVEKYLIIDKTDEVSFEVCKEPQKMATSLKECVAWLHAYFREPWKVQKLSIPNFHHPIFEKDSFTKTVLLALLNKVKIGETITYKQLAEIAGNEKAVRAVGGAMRNNPIPIMIPCHRVICSNGDIGNYSGGKANHMKLWLLAHEKFLKEM